MATKASTVITPDLSKAARRELTLTQSSVIAETGIQAYKLKQFEAGRFRPDIASLKKLRDFYESQGVDFDQLEAHAATSLPAAHGDAASERGMSTTAASPGFLISDDLPQEQVDGILDHMEGNDIPADQPAQFTQCSHVDHSCTPLPKNQAGYVDNVAQIWT